MTNSEWADLQERARATGLYVTTYSPGDGVTRYRFSMVERSYFAVSGSETLTTCLGRKESVLFIRGWLAGYGKATADRQLPTWWPK